jgi:hypothetical protein
VGARRRPSEPEERVRRPATTPEGREQQLVGDALDLAERQLRNGTASSQVITHFLKAGSTREELEHERLRHENELTRVKIEALERQERIEELYVDAIKAMRIYSGDTPQSDEDVAD